MNTSKVFIIKSILLSLVIQVCFGYANGYHGKKWSYVGKRSRRNHSRRGTRSLVSKGRRPESDDLDLQNCGRIKNDVDYYLDELDPPDESEEQDMEYKQVDAGTDESGSNFFEGENAVHVNPCTGSISFDTNYDLVDSSLPCLQETNTPSPKSNQEPSPTPSNLYNKVTKSSFPSPSISIEPSIAVTSTKSLSPSSSVIPNSSQDPSMFPSSSISTRPSVVITIQQTKIIESISCPQQQLEICHNFNNKTLEIDFKYSLETTDTIVHPAMVLPKLEETLLQRLADKLLSHCFNDQDSKLSANGDNSRRFQTRRNLKGNSRQLLNTVVGVCSKPKDEESTNGK